MQKKFTLKYLLFATAMFIASLVSGFIIIERTAFASFIINAWQGYKLTEGLVGYWSFDGKDIDLSQVTAEVRDASGQGNNGNWVNHATTTTIGKIGQGINFDGVDDSINIGDKDIYGPDADFTISAWVNQNFLTTFQCIFCKDTRQDGSEQFRFSVGENTSGKLSYQSATEGIVGTALLSPQEWHHVVITRSSATGQLTLYADGLIDNSSAVGTVPSAPTSDVIIGSRNNPNASEHWNGKIDEVRFYNRALSAEEVQRLYLMGASLKTNVSHRDELTGGLVGYWTFDGKDMTPNVRDVSGSGNHGGLQNQNPTTTTIGKIGQGLYIDGVDDYVRIPNGGGLNALTEGTISLWVKWAGTQDAGYLSSIYGPVTGRQSDAVFSNNIIGLNGADPASAKIKIYPYSVSSTLLGATAVGDGRWRHVVFTFVSGSQKLYIDGVLDGTLTDAGSMNNNSAIPLTIGAWIDAGVGYGKGTVDEVRTYNRVLSADEIKRLYLMGASLKINVSHRDELTDGLVGNWTFDGKDIDLSQVTAEVRDTSGQGNNGDWKNHATTTAIGKIGQAIDIFSSGVDVNAYIDIGDPGSGVLDFAGDFAVGFWMKGSGYVSQGSSNNAAVSKRNLSSANSAGYSFHYTSANLMRFTMANGSATFAVEQTTATVADGKWHHYVGIRTGSDIYLYVDGVLVDSDTGVSGSMVTGSSLIIGTDASVVPNDRNSNAVIDEVRVYNRALAPEEVKRLYLMGK